MRDADQRAGPAICACAAPAGQVRAGVCGGVWCAGGPAAWRWWWHTDAMTPWRVRDFHADDLDAAVRLWDNPAASSEAPAFSLSDLIAAVRSREPAVVAVAGEELAGTAVATVSGDRAWVMRISLAAAWRRRGIGSAMLGELERRLVAAGVHRIRCLLGGGSEIGALALEHAGYTARRGMVFYERLEPVDPGSAGVLGQLGGRMIRAGAWEQLGGMAREKELIERRVILPLAQPQLAERLGLVPPRAIVLFGPPGTGKTTFAKGAASRLGWPFVELFPSRLAGDPRPAWPPRSGRRSPWSPSWTRWCCSSTRWKRSPGRASRAPCPQPRGSPTRCSSSSRRSGNKMSGC